MQRERERERYKAGAIYIYGERERERERGERERERERERIKTYIFSQFLGGSMIKCKISFWSTIYYVIIFSVLKYILHILHKSV